MDNAIKDIVSQFSKPELLEIAEELRIKWDGESTVELSQKLSKQLRIMLEKEDVELSDLAFEFAETAEIIDVDGNVLDAKEEKKEEPVITIEKPECFIYSAANPADPSCKKCRVLEQCQKNRIANRPKCFGNPKLYDPKHPECERCLENIDNYCPQAVREKG